MVEKALALGPLDADVVLLGSGERGAVASGAAVRTAPRSMLPQEAGKIAGDAVQEAVGLALRGDTRAVGPALAAEPSAEIEEALEQLARVSDDSRLRERLETQP